MNRGATNRIIGAIINEARQESSLVNRPKYIAEKQFQTNVISGFFFSVNDRHRESGGYFNNSLLHRLKHKTLSTIRWQDYQQQRRADSKRQSQRLSTSNGFLKTQFFKYKARLVTQCAMTLPVASQVPFSRSSPKPH